MISTLLLHSSRINIFIFNWLRKFCRRQRSIEMAVYRDQTQFIVVRLLQTFSPKSSNLMIRDENNLNEILKWMYVYLIRPFIKATQNSMTIESHSHTCDAKFRTHKQRSYTRTALLMAERKRWSEIVWHRAACLRWINACDVRVRDRSGRTRLCAAERRMYGWRVWMVASRQTSSTTCDACQRHGLVMVYVGCPKYYCDIVHTSVCACV